MDFALPLAEEIERNVDAALAEDIGAGDLTASLIPAGTVGRATVISREDAVLCGIAWFDRVFRKLDPKVNIRWHAADGDRIARDQLLCEIDGDARALLSAERSGLNFLQLLSGVATKARQYADVVAGESIDMDRMYRIFIGARGRTLASHAKVAARYPDHAWRPGSGRISIPMDMRANTACRHCI